VKLKMEKNKMEKNKMEKIKKNKMVKEIKEFLIKNELHGDVCIYWDNKRWNSCGGEFVLEKDKKSSNHFDYNDDDGICLSFEGNLYDVLNYNPNDESFDKLLRKYNCYYELGNSWNCMIVEND